METNSEIFFETLVEGLNIGVIALDADLQILHWNHFVTQRTGKCLDDVRGRPIAKVFPETNNERFHKMIELVRSKGRHVYHHWLELSHLIPLRVESPDGDMLPLHSTLLFPYDHFGGVRRYGLIMYDTGAIARSSGQLEAALVALSKKQAEQDQLIRKLEAANSQLLQSEKLAAIGQLAAGVAHEINNPIGYVLSNLKTLDGYVLDMLRIIDAVDEVASLDELRQVKRALEYDYIREDIKALICESGDGIDRVKQIISALKDFSYIDEEEFRPADLHRGIETTLNVVNNEIKYKAEVVKEFGVLPELECIPSQINQVVMNLLVNAAHSIEQFGRITLRTACEGDWAWFEVEDTGKGIEKKLLNRIYEPFFTTKPVGKGTGLGLALSYNIVQKHNGRIEVHSEVGQGTCFRVWLPVCQPTALTGKDAK
ncbi:ATP-binding protein [Pseudomonas lopnurensis]|uniref:ATP-binding protein n=1 Tax=Pseudomonas lopnurensis TaxID=1477517 RepID=UPI0028AB2FE2|nr:ATP-binding protein [Pseudomonas lopnurensis]